MFSLLQLRYHNGIITVLCRPTFKAQWLSGRAFGLVTGRPSVQNLFDAFVPFGKALILVALYKHTFTHASLAVR